VNRAGNVSVPEMRAIVTAPSSSGWRSTSSVARELAELVERREADREFRGSVNRDFRPVFVKRFMKAQNPGGKVNLA
jgi:hypothetical protein